MSEGINPNYFAQTYVRFAELQDFVHFLRKTPVFSAQQYLSENVYRASAPVLMTHWKCNSSQSKSLTKTPNRAQGLPAIAMYMRYTVGRRSWSH